MNKNVLIFYVSMIKPHTKEYDEWYTECPVEVC